MSIFNYTKSLCTASLVIVIIALHSCYPASKNTTIILLRHSEKDTVGKDPSLSAAGFERAARIPTLFKSIKPDAFYSTPYLRTRQTLEPWATKAGLSIKEYNAAKPDTFVQTLLSNQGKTLVVAGHSNTIPGLVNLLLKQNKYSNLNDSVYSQLWIVTIRKGKASEKVMEY